MKDNWGLDPTITFLNHGSFGACPKAVLEAQRELRDRLEAEPVRFIVREAPGLLDAAREALGRFLGAHPEDLAFVPNATTGVNSVLRSLRLQPGDGILTTDHEYNATRNVIDFVAGAAGAEVQVARLPFPVPDGDGLVGAVLEAVTPRTRIAVLDHVTSATGLVLPLGRILPRLAELGIQTLVDGAHAPGMIPLHLGSLGASWYTGNCHKWICAPKGSAFLWVPRAAQAAIRPAVISHGANTPPVRRSRFRLEFDWTGTSDPTAWLAVPEALRFMGSLLPGGWPAVMARNHQLVVEGRQTVLDALGIPEPAPAEVLGSLASIPLPPAPPGPPQTAFDTDPLQDRLLHDHRIEVPVMPWTLPPPCRLLRISAQIYNTPEDYRRLAGAVRNLLGR